MSCGINTESLADLSPVDAWCVGYQAAWQEVREYNHCDQECHLKKSEGRSCTYLVDCLDVNLGRYLSQARIPVGEETFVHQYGTRLPIPAKQES